jgi:hypothetical protein
MPPRIHSIRTYSNRKNGFALIASLSIMAMLVMIAVALYSMSAVATRSAEITSARTEAQANAKMALMVAIGELQQSMGPDQRISANAAILDGDPDTSIIDDITHKHWVGTWDSWIAGGTSGSAHSTIQGVSDGDMHPDYAQKTVNNGDGGYFRSWLVSLPEDDRTNIGAAINPTEPLIPRLNPNKDTNSVFLVHEGSLGDLSDTSNLNDATDRVAAGLVEVKADGSSSNTVSRYAWWVGDESQKATILSDSYDSQSSLTDADRIYRAQAPATMGTNVIPGFANVSDESQLDRLSTFKTLDLVSLNPQTGANDPKLSQLNFFHTTTSSLGVLADVREGGLKRDLNTILERPINLEDSGNEFMLYKFNGEQEQVPIQDLSAFYQLYRDSDDFAAGGRGGIKYTSSELNGSIQTEVPDYGASDENYLREYLQRKLGRAL